MMPCHTFRCSAVVVRPSGRLRYRLFGTRPVATGFRQSSAKGVEEARSAAT